jgi:Na+-driven multidrug efflux pump
MKLIIKCFIINYTDITNNMFFSIRVSNELGANHPKAAKFSVIIAVSTSAIIGLIFTIIVLIERKTLPKFFTGSPDLIKETSKLGFLLAATIFLNSIQPVLSGILSSETNCICNSYQKVHYYIFHDLSVAY